MPGERGELGECRPPIGADLYRILPALEDRHRDRGRVAGERGALAHAVDRVDEASAEVGHRRRDVGGALLERHRREERLVHFLSQAEQRGTNLGL